MKSPPKTREEARWLYRGTYFEGGCAWQMVVGGQCCRGNGHGPGKLYCKQHAPIVEAYYEGGEE